MNRGFSALVLTGLIVIHLLSTGCSTISLDVPGPLIESPEIAGGAGLGEIGFGTDDSTRFTYTGDASARPPDLNLPRAEKSGYVFSRAGYNVTDALEIGLRYVPGNWDTLFIGGLGLTSRFQLLGAGPAPGIKIAIYGGLLSNSTSAKGDQNGTFGPGGYDWKASANSQTLTAGTSIGYRFPSPNLMVYLAGAYADQHVWGNIEHSASTNGTSPQATYALTDIRANARSMALGLRLGSDVKLGFETRLIKRSWPGLSVPETRGGGETTDSITTVSLSFQ